MKKIFTKMITFSFLFIFTNSISLSQTFTDTRDEHVYKMVTIGSQTWMAENLVYQIDVGCWAYNNKYTYAKKYGYLYNWKTALKVCPDGWHLPSDKEWTELETFLGFEKSDLFKIGYRGGGADSLLKSTDGWNKNGNGLNTSGFNALPAGYRDYYNGDYGDITDCGYWWTSSRYGYEDAWYRSLSFKSDKIIRNRTYKEYGHSVRCIKN